MSRSRSRLAADWFAKLRINTQTQEVEHEDVVAEQEALDAAEAKIASDMATAIAGATISSGDILTSLKTVDGSGSGLDADLLDGFHASSFLRSTAHSFSTNGYQKLSNGLIMQWGYSTGSSSGWYTYFPIAFPNAVFSVVATSRDNGGINFYNRDPSTTRFYVHDFMVASRRIRWVAFGY